jgi:TolB-like protein
MSLYFELKRRNVFRVGAAYIVAAWLIIQVAETIFPLYGLGDTPARITVTLLAIGFPLFLIFSWVFEITPEGLKKEKNIDRSVSITHKTGKQLDRIIIVLLTLALGYFAFDKFVLDPARDAVLVEETAQQARSEALLESYGDQSIAVLPFVNMSADPDQEYFSDGISEELLNLLAKNPELRVISRSSAFSYKGKDVKLNQVAEELNVAHILEGSVRKSGDRVRITAQLIEARSDTHLWSETYDRQLVDIFAVQDEIAAAISEALQLQLSGRSPLSAAEESTDNPEAYQLFLQGRHLWRQRNAPALQQAIQFLTRAVQLDPGFHRAWTSLATAYINLPQYDRSVDRSWAITKSNEALDRALELAPNNSDILTIKANFLQHQCNPLDAARLFEAALKANPNDVTALHWYAYLEGNTGRIASGLEHIRKARRIDPLISAVLAVESNLLSSLGRHEEAVAHWREAVALGIYGGSSLGEGLVTLQTGRVEEAIHLVREGAGELDPIQAAKYLRFADAVLDRGQQEAFEQSLGMGDPDNPYETNEKSGLLAQLGSPHMFEFLSAVPCPYLHPEIWWEPFREQRGTKEFFELMSRTGVVEYWREFGWPDDCESLDQQLVDCPEQTFGVSG